jgi:arylsulfatase
MQAVRAGKWKAVRREPGRDLEIYDLEMDIEETNNIAQQHPEVVERMEAILQKAHVPSEFFPMSVDK